MISRKSFWWKKKTEVNDIGEEFVKELLDWSVKIQEEKCSVVKK